MRRMGLCLQTKVAAIGTARIRPWQRLISNRIFTRPFLSPHFKTNNSRTMATKASPGRPGTTVELQSERVVVHDGTLARNGRYETMREVFHLCVYYFR